MCIITNSVKQFADQIYAFEVSVSLFVFSVLCNNNIQCVLCMYLWVHSCMCGELTVYVAAAYLSEF